MSRKFFVITLGLLFLFIVSAGNLAHNHPLSQKETASCPAYILSLTIHSEPILPQFLPTALPEPLFTFNLTSLDPTFGFIAPPFSNRAPPLF